MANSDSGQTKYLCHRWPLVLATIGITACAPTAQETPGTIAPPEVPDDQLPLIGDESRSTSADFIRVFSRACFEHFPNVETTRAAFVSAGFEPRSPETEDISQSTAFRDQERGLFASFGIETMFWDGPDGGGAAINDHCEVSGEVSDPDVLEFLINDGALGLDWDTQTFVGSAIAEAPIQGRSARIFVEFQRIYAARTNLAGPPDICNGLDACRYSSESSIKITFSE